MEFNMINKLAIRCILIFLLANVAVSNARAQSSELFQSSSQMADIKLTDEQTRRMGYVLSKASSSAIRIVSINESALDGSSVILQLPDGEVLRIDKSNKTVRSQNTYSWSGRVFGTEHRVNLVVQAGEITGLLRYQGKIYDITPLGGGLHTIALDTKTKFIPQHPPGPLPTAPAGEKENQGSIAPSEKLRPASGNTVIDILIPYTSAARAARPNIAAVAQLAVDVMNTAYTDSGIDITQNLVGTMEVAYSEAGKTFLDLLQALQAGTDPQMALVHAQRDALGADLVGMLINLTEYCGLGYLNSSANWAFSVTNQSCAANGFTFAHEVGHNMGAHHDTFVANNSDYPYGHGFVEPGKTWRTIMAYRNACQPGSCSQIGRFSTPLRTYGGSVTGTVTSEDNARVHNERAETVAAFRPSGGGSILAAGLPTWRAGPVGTTVTAFATMINTSSNAATDCEIRIPAGTPATFEYQTVDASNQVTGTANTPVDIPAGSSQSFVFAVTPTSTTSRNLALEYVCSNSNPAVTTYGLNTFGFSSGTGLPDMVAIASTIGNTGYAKIPSDNGSTVFTVAVVNIGSTRAVTARITEQAINGTDPNMNATMTICRSNNTGACESPVGTSVSWTATQNVPYTFTVFVTGTGFVANNPSVNRAHVYFDYGSLTTGATGVAVCTAC